MFCYIFTLSLLCLIANTYSETIPEKTDSSSKEMEFILEMILDDINVIKRKVWAELPAKIHELEQRIEEKGQNSEKCSCAIEPRVQNGTGSTGYDLMGKEQYLTVLKAFQQEKLKARLNEKRLHNALLKISELENELTISMTNGEELATKIEVNKENDVRTMNEIEDIQQSVNELEESYDDIRLDLLDINNTYINSIGKSNHGNGLPRPSFTSRWLLMRAQDPSHVQLFVPHGLGVLPYKVEVQIRPTSGPNAGWIFHGDAAFQSDDDTSKMYGGIVYFYDETHVILSAPIKNNNGDLGTIINTGSAESMRLGNNHENANETYVRVKVWAPNDLPTPEYKTDWLPLDITNTSLTYYELQHGLGGYPGLINVQIRCNSSNGNIISEGVGATMMHRAWSNAGGVVWAFSDTSVRLWTGFLDKDIVKSSKPAIYYRLTGSPDGWGSNPISGVDVAKGQFRILAWNREYFVLGENLFEHFERNVNVPELHTFGHISHNKDLLSFYVEASDGPNRGFRFRGYGNSQAIEAPFGGAVYAFHPAGDIRVWRPNPSAGGHLVHIHSPYGNGMNVQASDNATYVSMLIKAN